MLTKAVPFSHTQHPLDAYFLEVIRQKRAESQEDGLSSGGKKLKIDFATYQS